MTELTLTFTGKLSCGKCEDVLLWLHNPYKLAINAGVTDTSLLRYLLEAEITEVVEVNTQNYQYTVQYDETLLQDPTDLLSECDIRQLCCSGCLIQYVDETLVGAIPVETGMQQWSTPLEDQPDNATAAIALSVQYPTAVFGALAMVSVLGVPTWFKYDGADWTLAI